MSRRWFSISLAVTAFTIALLLALGEVANSRRLNILVLTVESTRASDFTEANFPQIFSAARSATRFSNHRAEAAWTAPNIIAVLAGLSPFAQGIHARDQTLPDDITAPLSELASDGWRVAGLQSFMAISVFDRLGLSVELGRDLRGWLAARIRNRQAFVLWYHYLPTHLPYAPSPEHMPDWRALLPRNDVDARRRIEAVMTEPVIPSGSILFQPSDRPAIRALYLANLKGFDDWFGSFWTFFNRSGLRDNTILVLTADHGDEQLDHGELGHASTNRHGHMPEEIVHVPLVIWVPPRLQTRLQPGLREDESWHTDIMPTLFALLDRTPKKMFSGRSLLTPGAGTRAWNGVTSGAGYAEPDPGHIRRFVFARKEGPWKLQLEIVDGAVTRRELYKLSDDPGETHNRIADEPKRAAEMEHALLAERAAMRPPSLARAVNTSVSAERPALVYPIGQPVMGYDDFGGHFRLEWTGAPDQSYVVQYEAGEGWKAFSGQMEVKGTVKDFGVVDRAYWDRWVVPYGRVRVRVRPAGRNDLWSQWLDIQLVSQR
jgi:arylsulfatase A-like enzyme